MAGESSDTTGGGEGVHMLGDLRGLEVPSVREKGSEEGSVRKATFMLSVMNQT